MKYKNKIICFLLALISTFSLLVELDINTIVKITSKSTISLTYLVLGLLIFNLYSKYDKSRNYRVFNVLSTLLSLLMIFGYSYDKLDSWNFVFGNYIFIIISVVKLIGYYYLFKVSIHKLYDYIKGVKITDVKSKIIDKFNKKPILYSAIIILICWLPYIISFYPGILSPDPTNQIKSFFGIPTRYIDGINLIDKNVLITNDNPFLHTVLLGGAVKIGKLLGSDNLGIFIYSIIQIAILLSALLYSIKYLKKIKSPNLFIVIALLIYALVPVFPLYAMSTVKDVIFGALILILVIKIFDFITYNNFKNKDWIYFSLLLLAICLSRNNGIYHVLLSVPFLLIFEKKMRKIIILTLVGSISIYLAFINIGLPLLHITEGNKREMFSIPFQQTARYVKYYGNDLTNEEKIIIDKVLDIDTIVDRYQPIKADPVKNGFNAQSTDKDFSNYIKLWGKLLLRHPNVYIEATANNVYGYFYPNTTKWYIYYKEYNERLNETGKFNYHYIKNLKSPRDILSAYGTSFPHIPVIGMFVNIGFVVWLYLFMLALLIKEKLYKHIVVIAPALSLILVCIASPANTYFRYALPFVFALPVTIFMLYNVIKEKKRY